MLSALLRKEREGSITTRHRQAAWRQMEDDLKHRRLNLVVSLVRFRAANAILAGCHPDVALRSVDAIHLAAAAQCASWPVVYQRHPLLRAAANPHGIPAVTAAWRKVTLGFAQHPAPDHGGSCCDCPSRTRWCDDIETPGAPQQEDEKEAPLNFVM